MRPSLLLVAPSLAAKALAHDVSHLHSDGYCHSPILSSFPLLSTPVCTHDTLITKYQATTSHSPANRAWTRASSCTANGTEEYCVFTSATFGGGRGISVVTSPQRANYIANLPAFTSPEALQFENSADPSPHSTLSKFEFVHVPGKDMGVVATRPIYRGDHLMSFSPAVVIDYGAFDSLSAPDIQRLQMEAADALPSGLRSLFMNLSTHDGASDHQERVEKILRTNAFDVDLWDDNEYGIYVVFPEISRFNHDCRPNADYWFDPETLVQHVFATRPIAVGEEISVTYIDPIRPRNKRRKKLHNIWGFDCSCALCTQRREQTDASDDRIRHIRRIRKQLEDYTTASPATPQMADLFVSLYEQERLSGSIYEAYAFAAIEWNGIGEPWTAVRYARLGIEAGLAAVGPKDRDVIEMQSLAEDPFGHWSWMLRTSKRMSWGRMREFGINYMRGNSDDEEE